MNLATLLSDLANLHTSAAAIRRLREKWPDFLPEAPRNPTITIQQYAESVPKELHYVLYLRGVVQSLWVGNVDATKDLEPILLTGKIGFAIPIFNAAPQPGIIGIDWKHQSFVYRPQTLLQKALYFLMQNSHKAKVCANPDCPAPYFIGSRSNLRYCSPDCLQVVQQQAKRDWWRESGQKWRESRKGPRRKR